MKRAAFLAALSLSFSLSAQADDVCQDEITMLYHERIPYVMKYRNSIEGVTGTPAVQAFENAGIQVDWQETPVKRQLIHIRNNTGCTCSVGWFKNKEREVFARYSKPIYQDKPQVAITSSKDKQLEPGKTLEHTLKNEKLTLLVKDGYSYGKYIDEKVQQVKPNTYTVSYENIKMLSLIYHQRYDYFFIAPEEVDPLVEASSFTSNDFKVVNFSDMPAGEKTLYSL